LRGSNPNSLSIGNSITTEARPTGVSRAGNPYVGNTEQHHYDTFQALYSGIATRVASRHACLRQAGSQ